MWVLWDFLVERLNVYTHHAVRLSSCGWTLSQTNPLLLDCVWSELISLPKRRRHLEPQSAAGGWTWQLKKGSWSGLHSSMHWYRHTGGRLHSLRPERSLDWRRLWAVPESTGNSYFTTVSANCFRISMGKLSMLQEGSLEEEEKRIRETTYSNEKRIISSSASILSE